MADSKLVTDFLTRLGLDTDERSVYISLATHGATTLTELSRISGVERTSIYRMLDSLQLKGIVKIKDEHKRRIAYPAKPQELLRIIDQEEIRLHSLRNQQSSFTSQIEEMTGSQTDTSVTYYKGVEGVKQVLWNMLNCKSKTIYSVLDHCLAEIIEPEFFNSWGKRFRTLKLQNKAVYSNSFKSSIRKSRSKLTTDPLNGVGYYYIDPAKFDLTQSIESYDDYVIYFNWAGEKCYAVEICNPNIAYSTRQMICLLITQTDDKAKTWTELRAEVTKS